MPNHPSAHRSDRSVRGPSRRLVAVGVATALLGAGVAAAPAASAAAPIVAKVAPAAAQPGHGVVLSGDFLTGATEVRFLGTAAPEDDAVATVFEVLNAKTLYAQVPPTAVNGPVRVTTPEGPGVTPVPLVVWRAPVIDSLSAAVGKGLDSVTVTGSWLGGKRKVLLAGKAVTVTSPAVLAGEPASELSFLVPGGLPGGPTTLTVTNEGGTATAPFYIAPEVKAVAPKAGSTAGGGVAIVSGSGFTGAESVTFGGVPAPQLLRTTDKEIVVRVPAGAAGTAPVVVHTRNGTTTADSVNPASLVPATYQYQPVPTVTAVAPNWHPVTAATDPAPTTPVVITGENLTPETAVLFGTLPVTPAVDAVAKTLSFVPPPSAKAAVVNVTLVNTVDGVAYKTVVPFGYVGAPVVTKVAPVTGPAGSTVTISGTGFTPASVVTLGAATASCGVVSFVAISCVVPPGSGSVGVSVTTESGTSAGPAVPFLYGPGPVLAPVVKKLNPAAGLAGSTVDVAGANLQLVKTVQFPAVGGGWVTAPDVLVVTPSRLVVKVPAGATSGQLRLTPHRGAAVQSGVVRYLAVVRPSISSVDAVGDNTVGVVGGDTVVLRGSGLMVGTTLPVVTIGGVAAPVLKTPVPTAASVAVKVPAGVGKQAPVVVTTAFGSASASVSLYYVPKVTGAKPAGLLPDGRTAVLVAGLGFTGAPAVTTGAGRLSAVTFGGVPADQVVVVSDKLILAVAPAGQGIVDGVVVTTQHGTWTGTSAGVTRALAATTPTIASVSPDETATGGVPANVTVTGTNLRTGAEFAFGGEPASTVSVAPDGLSAVVAPPSRATAATVAVSVTQDVAGEPYTTSKAGAFSYLPIPTVSGISPAAGFTGSQQPDVTITGTNLFENTLVRFGSAGAVVQSAASDGTSLVVSPPVRDAVGPVTVTVTNVFEGRSRSATAVAGYGYSLAVATVTGLSTTSAVPGTPVTITGTSFVGVTAVRIGSTPVAWSQLNGSTLYATVPVTPSGLHGTSQQVVVVNGTTTASSGGPSWTWDAKPAVTGLSASTGAAGSTVTISGTGFSSPTVQFGSVPATVVSSTPTSITVTVPSTPSAGSLANVTVTTAAGTSPEPPTATANDWTWAPIAVISAIAPGIAAAGSSVTVTGTGFTVGQSVAVEVEPGNELTAAVTALTPTSFTFTMPPAPAGNLKSGPKRLLVVNTSGTTSRAAALGSNIVRWQ